MSQIEEELPPSDKDRHAIKLNVRCGQCIYFKSQKIFKLPCIDMGIKKYATPCKKFTVDPYQFKNIESNHSTASKLLATVNDSNLAMLAALFSQEIKTRRNGFKHGQEIIIKTFGEDYLSNYVRAMVITANKEFVYVQAIDHANDFRGTYMHSTVMTLDQFTRKKKSLIRRNRIVDPKFKEYSSYKIPAKKLKNILDWMPPTIDDVTIKDKKINTKPGKTKVTRVRGNID